MALKRVQAATILHWGIVAIGEASSGLGVLLGFCPSPCTTCFALRVMGLGPRFRVFSS